MLPHLVEHHVDVGRQLLRFFRASLTLHLPGRAELVIAAGIALETAARGELELVAVIAEADVTPSGTRLEIGDGVLQTEEAHGPRRCPRWLGAFEFGALLVRTLANTGTSLGVGVRNVLFLHVLPARCVHSFVEHYLRPALRTLSARPSLQGVSLPELFLQLLDVLPDGITQDGRNRHFVVGRTILADGGPESVVRIDILTDGSFEVKIIREGEPPSGSWCKVLIIIKAEGESAVAGRPVTAAACPAAKGRFVVRLIPGGATAAAGRPPWVGQRLVHGGLTLAVRQAVSFAVEGAGGESLSEIGTLGGVLLLPQVVSLIDVRRLGVVVTLSHLVVIVVDAVRQLPPPLLFHTGGCNTGRG